MLSLLFYAFVALFLAGTVISLLGTARDTRIIRTLSLACTTGASLILAVLSLIILVTGVPFTPAAWQLFPGFSVEFFIDRLAAFFLFLIGSVSACVAVYTMGYVEHMEGGNPPEPALRLHQPLCARDGAYRRL